MEARLDAVPGVSGEYGGGGEGIASTHHQQAIVVEAGKRANSQSTARPLYSMGPACIPSIPLASLVLPADLRNNNCDPDDRVL